MHRNGKRIALSLVAIVLGAGFLLKVIPPETIIGDNDHHSASIDGLLITNPVDVNDPVSTALFPPAASPVIGEVSEKKSSSSLWIPGEPESAQSLSSPTHPLLGGNAPIVENNKGAIQQPVSGDNSPPDTVTEPSKPDNMPGPLLHDPKDSGASGGGSSGGGSSQPGSPGSGSDDRNPPPQDGSIPPPSRPNDGPANPIPGNPSDDDDKDDSFPPSGPGDFPGEDTKFPSNPGELPSPPSDGKSPEAPHSVPDQGSSLALTFGGLVILATVRRSMRQ